MDPAGVLTIGYGHTGSDVFEGDRISKYWAEQTLLDALVSFTFNLGIDRLKSSTLLKVIKEGGSMRQIKREFKRWVHAGGQTLRGLEKRRAWEADRFFAKDEF